MYGEWITLDLGENIKCQVYISCTPNITHEEKEDRAFNKLTKELYKGR